MTIKFRSTGNPIRVALLTGHITWINEEWTELEPRFHQAALAAGAISESFPQEDAPKPDEPIDVSMTDALKAAMLKMLDRIGQPGSEADFTLHGWPSTPVVNKLAGFNAERELVNKSFAELAEIEPRAKAIRERKRS
jgi:predicted component of type VI protein secretion system